MSYRDRRGVDEAFDTRLDTRLSRLMGAEDGDNQPENYQSDPASQENSVAVETASNPVHRSRSSSEEVIPPEERRNTPSSLVGDVPVIRHVEQSDRILSISSLIPKASVTGSRRVDSQSQGLYLVSRPESGDFTVDVIFIYEVFGGSHPYLDWLAKDTPEGDDYLPDDVKAYIPLARVWAYGYQTSYDDESPLSSAANNFLVYYGEQRQRDQRNNPSIDTAAVSKLVFICVGFGGIMVKKILLDCLQSSNEIQKSIASSCQGVVFMGTYHLPVHKDLTTMAQGLKVYPNSMLRSIGGGSFPNFKGLLKEMKIINQDFLDDFSKMPRTFCVVNLYKQRFVPDSKHGLFPPEKRRPGRDEHISVTEKSRAWSKLLYRSHPTFITIMTQVRNWSPRSGSAMLPNVLPDTVGAQMVQITGGVNLLSVDGGGVRGLASLLILERIMEEIARLEVAEDPSTAQKVRVPADYFDLAGGTSTGGLICIMLFRLRMDVQSAISEYYSLSPKIFHQSPMRFLGSNIAKTAIGMPWFEGEALEDGVKRIVKGRISWREREILGADAHDAPLLSSVESTRESSCKTFLCALKKDDNSAVRFRAYPPPEGATAAFQKCKIWEAARATAAAPFYFPTAVVEGVKFWDGGLANNNPVLEVLSERLLAYPGRKINCVISLGTGFSECKPTKSVFTAVGKGKQVLKNVTNVNINHERAEEQLKAENVSYFRFNPSTAEDKIGLADYKLLKALSSHTERYLGREQTKALIKDSALLLYHRSSVLEVEN